jgi:hypothetical protein
MTTKMQRPLAGFLLMGLGAVLILAAAMAYAGSLEEQFLRPPDGARPWVYWFWNNGNVTSNGITADLEAMRRVGLGGALIMDVVERFAPPRGTAEFMNPEWRALFEFAAQEAARLGLEINMANGPGWCGSSGPWITPELSMQKLVWTNFMVAGPSHFQAVLPTPDISDKARHAEDSLVRYADFYRDIELLAFPDMPANEAVPRGAVMDLTPQLKADGKLDWQVPPGKWILQRIGYTTTGSTTRPPVAGGNGLECDKLSREAMDAHFANMMGRLIAAAGPLVGKSLVATHIDSWEVGAQNWTPAFRAEFLKRRGYDPLPWLPCVTDVTRMAVNGKTNTADAVNLDGAAAERFRWDFHQTIAELLAENYSGRIAELAHEHGLRYTLEGYNLPFGDEFTYTARADEPMTEFWTQTSYGLNETFRKASQMASVGHVYGRAIIGAESFTSGDKEMWKLTPADIKALGDFEFSQGVNRFVVHRYAHQPYLDRAPGATMGPWGLHYERTQTWWEMSAPWHQYLARCQFLLRQGKFVADLLYLRPETPDQTYFNPVPPPPAGYRFDEISAEALMRRVSVKNGKLVLPDGMHYRLLVLPDAKTMTPALARKILELARDGAAVMATGPRPAASPSLQDFPRCDATMAKLGREIWGECDRKTITEHAPGSGRVFWGESLPEVLSKLNVAPDFSAAIPLNWIHRRDVGADIYFVANPAGRAVEALCAFRVGGLRPELWNPETGDISPLACYVETASAVSVPLRFDPSGSVFVVFRQPSKNFDPVAGFQRDGHPVPSEKPAVLKILRASYGVPGDADRTLDARAKIQAMADRGQTAFQVADMAEDDDPAEGVVKTLSVDYDFGGQALKAASRDPDTVTLGLPAPERPAEMVCDHAGYLTLAAREPGRYEWKTAAGKSGLVEVPAVPPPISISGPWLLAFPPNRGAPASLALSNLLSWSECAEEGVRHFSGTAVYSAAFDFPDAMPAKNHARYFLNLGEVRVMARVKVNGRDCGIAWKPPFRVDVTDAVRPGKNDLEIQVANLWPNRMIGDAALPEQQRLSWSSWEPFKKDAPLLKSGLIGPVAVETTLIFPDTSSAPSKATRGPR